MKHIPKAFAVAALTMTILASKAYAITFDFTGQDTSLLSQLTLSSEGLDLTVTAGIFPGFDDPNSAPENPSDIVFTARFVDLEPTGLGVNAGLDTSSIDGFFGNDVAVFTFSQDVIIESVGFTNATPGGSFAFGTVSGNSFDRIVDSQLLPTPVQQIAPFGLTAIASQEQRTGQSFGFGAIADGGVVIDPFFELLPIDSYLITSVTVTVSEPQLDDPLIPPTLTPVPLPTSGLMLLGGVALIGGFAQRRFRKIKAANL